MQNPDNWDRDLMDYIYFKRNGRWNVWTSIGPSTLVSTNSRRNTNYGLGLFARRLFRTGHKIGFYSGRRLTRQQTMRSTSNYVITMVNQESGSEVFVDGQTGTTGYIQFANDPRGTMSEANAVLYEDGFLVASRNIRVGQEILIDYGHAYWNDNYFS